MDPVSLFELATSQSKWLSARQSAVASNIANINTPGYRTKDVDSFAKLLNSPQVSPTGSNSQHLGVGAGRSEFPLVETGAAPSSSDSSSVSMEEELVKSSDIRAAFELNSAIVKAFHRMITQVSKG